MGKYTTVGMEEHADEMHTNVTRKIWVNNIVNHTGDDSKSLGIALGGAGESEKINYQVVLPDDFVALEKLSLYTAASTDHASGVALFAVTSQYGGIDEEYSLHTETESILITIALNDQYITRSTDYNDVDLGDAVVGDIIGFWIDRDSNIPVDTYGADVIVRGIMIEYEAKQ